jgi:2-amino-4-hydroxy-6-hydroxymethyldihydropteridine diphosphokinase
MIYNYILSLGSNIEPREDYLVKALKELKSIGRIIKKSSIYETDAWGNYEQSKFYNAIINFESSLAPNKLLQALKKIEKSIGRKKSFHWGPREIDIDIIFCQDYTVDEPDLKIPHPEFAERRFILQPLLEINKYYLFSDSNNSIAEVLSSCKDKSSINKLDLSW